MTTWSRRWIPQHRNPAWLWRNPSSSWVKHQNMGSFGKRNNATTNINKLRWYPQQPQRFIFTTISQACCQAKRWKHLSVLQSLPDLLRNLLWTEASQALSGTFYGTRWTWLGFAPRLPGTFSGTSWHGSDLLRNLLQNTVEPDLALHQSLGTFAGISLNLSGLKTPLAYAVGKKVPCSVRSEPPGVSHFRRLFWLLVNVLQDHQGGLSDDLGPSDTAWWDDQLFP